MAWHSALARTTAVAAVVLVAAASGCLPNRGAVSPDGRTFYFSLNKKAGFEVEEGSNVYALDVETGRLKALTDGPGLKGWCSVTFDGKILVYGTLGGPGATIVAVDIQEGTSTPVSGFVQGCGYPWVVPGEPPHVVAVTQKSKDEMRWALLGEHGDMPLGPLADYKACVGNIGLAASRFAAPVWRATEEGDVEKVETSVWVVDLSSPPAPAAGGEKSAAPPAGEAKPAETPQAETKAPAPAAKPGPAFTCVAKWTNTGGKGGGPVIDLAFSPDGKRLVTAVRAEEGKEPGPTRFFDVDPTGKEQPKLLFEVPGGREPQVTPDGSGVVYLRPTAGDDGGREVVLWRPDLKEARLIARLPGELEKAFTTCFWMKDGRLRIYHVCDEGLWLIDAAADGAGAKARRLTHERLAAQKYLADFERGLGHVPDAPPENLPEPLAGAVNAVGRPLQDAAKPVQDALKAAWAAASVWNAVAAVGPLGSARRSAAESMIALKLLADAALAYAKDNGGRLPPADAYPDGLKKYLNAAAGRPFPMPEGKALALNAALAGRRMEEVADPRSTVLLFEAKPGGPLAGGRELLRDLAGEEDAYVAAFADGRVEWLSQEELAKKTWQPAASRN